MKSKSLITITSAVWLSFFVSTFIYYSPSEAVEIEAIVAKETPLNSLEFMIGDWKLTEHYADNPEQIVVVDTATVHVRYTVDGRGIISQGLHPYEGMEEVFAGTTVFRPHPDTGNIVGVSVNSLGNRKFLESSKLGNEVSLETRGELFSGGSGYNVGTFHKIEKDRFEYSSSRCLKSGEPCVEGTYYYVAERIQAISGN